MARAPRSAAAGDLDEFGTTPDPATGHIVRTTRSPAWWLARCAAQTSVALHGACIGAGIELAAFARQVTAAEDAFFQLPEVALGLIPGAGGTVSLPRRIGRQRTAWLALSGRRVDAATALRGASSMPGQWKTSPPLTSRAWPVITAERSDAKKTDRVRAVVVGRDLPERDVRRDLVVLLLHRLARLLSSISK